MKHRCCTTSKRWWCAESILKRGVLELLQRTNLDLDARRLRGEPALFLGERIDALALGLRRDRDGRHLESAGHRENAGALLADRVMHRLLERLEHGAHALRVDA